MAVAVAVSADNSSLLRRVPLGMSSHRPRNTVTFMHFKVHTTARFGVCIGMLMK